MKIRDRIKSLRRVKASDLLPHPANWRTHPQSQQDAMRGILAEIGFAGAALVRETPDGLQFIDGHLRGDLAGDSKIPCLVLDVTEAEALKILATHDPLASMAEASEQALGELLAQIETESEALQSMLDGLAEEHGIDLCEPGAEELQDPEPQIDRAAELQAIWKTEPGQLWTIEGKAGEHRLLCGDSTKREDVERVCEGTEVQAVVTDPPYGVGLDYDGCDDTPEALAGLVEKFLPLCRSLSPLVGLTPGNGNQRYYPHADWVLGWFFASGCNRVSWGFQNWQPILAWGKDPYLARGLGARPDAFWVSEKMEDVPHPCSKPTQTWTWIVERFAPEAGAVVLDPFLGSGTTLVACENLGRRGVGLEISPAYVAVVLQRMKDLGLDPQLEEVAP